MEEMEEVKEPTTPPPDDPVTLSKAEVVDIVMASKREVESPVPTKLVRVPPGRMIE
jgi:hypothetical protein